MRKINIRIPYSYQNYNLETDSRIIHKEYTELIYDIVIEDDIKQLMRARTRANYLIFDGDYEGLRSDIQKEVDLFIVKDLIQYEQLFIEYRVPKEKIYILPLQEKAVHICLIIESLEKQFQAQLSDIQLKHEACYWPVQHESLKIEQCRGDISIKSSLDKEKHIYIYYLDEINISEEKGYLIKNEFEMKGNLEVELFILTYKQERQIDTFNIDINTTKVFEPIQGAEYIKIALRIKGSGEVLFKKLEIVDYTKDIISEQLLSENEDERYLILTNMYPNKQNLYRNGFVHRRVVLYKERGLRVDVFACNSKNRGLESYCFDKVQVYGGDEKALQTLLRVRKYKKILIHFVNENMVEAIEQVDDTIPFIVWIHGFETERWHRRRFNYTEEEIKRNLSKWEKEDDKKMSFMKRIYTDPKNTFIFVSKWFMEAVGEEDAGCKVTNYKVVPNVVDGDIFKFIPKGVEQRKRILTIRPFASKKYANDLTVQAILELSKKDFFKDLIFDIYGRGPLFEEVLSPIRHFENVHIYETFLTQEEIAREHRKHGIFICPTRLDAQGVSMCEAMSSGLIPITNGVTAIPEYVNEEIGILAPEEDYMTLARGVEKLYYDIDMFKKMSYKASISIQEKCGIENVINEEIKYIEE